MTVRNTERGGLSRPAAVVLWILLLGFFMIGGIPFLGHHLISNLLVRDHSARWINQGSFSWQGNVYTMTTGIYREGRTIAKTEDGSFDVNEVQGDPDHIFLVVRTGIDQALYVREDYLIPSDGVVTTVCWGSARLTDEELCSAVEELTANAKTDFIREMDEPYSHTEDWEMKSLYLAYQDCPVPTQYMGELGHSSGKWVITTNIIPAKSEAPYGQQGPYEVSCAYVPEELAAQMEKYLH